MKILKKILMVLVVIIAIPLITAIFVKKEYAVERDIVIIKPKSEVFDYLKILRNQDNFSKWATVDPEMKKTYSGTDGTIGFISAWASDNDQVGVGEQEIVKLTEGDRIDYELRFFKPFKAINFAYMKIEVISENETKVKWGFKGTMDYPSNFMLLFMNFERIIGDDFQTGLEKLKSILEQ